jgi:hypothetical protein
MGTDQSDGGVPESCRAVQWKTGDCHGDDPEQRHPPSAPAINLPREGEAKRTQREEEQEDEHMKWPACAKLCIPVVDEGIVHQVEGQQCSD